MKSVFIILFFVLSAGVFSQSVDRSYLQEVSDSTVVNGAERMSVYLPMLEGKNVGLVVNQTSVCGNTHLVDTLIGSGIKVRRIFAPEHGFRGNQADGDHVISGHDSITGIEVTSLFGSHFKPDAASLSDIEIMVFDIQDVGVRFYTYISTMHYVMEACAEHGIPLIILDRPNPNGHYIDGPVLSTSYRSFVGMHPIPLVHGLTVGELAGMINGEGWLLNHIQCDITVVPCLNWDHKSLYQLPVKPSPNLVSMEAVYLYPSLGLFEGTTISVGRGTMRPFEVFGHPILQNAPISFVPEAIAGMSDNPPWKGDTCYGYDVKRFSGELLKYQGRLHLYWICEMYATFREQHREGEFWNARFFDKLAGGNLLRKQISNGLPPEKIENSWQPGLKSYRILRKKYLLYPDFE